MNHFHCPHSLHAHCRFAPAMLVLALALTLLLTASAAAQDGKQPAMPTLFLVGDSIMKTGTGTGEKGPWGFGSEIIPLFDAAKIRVQNEGRGGRSSRGYIEEGLWAKIVEQ